MLSLFDAVLALLKGVLVGLGLVAAGVALKSAPLLLLGLGWMVAAPFAFLAWQIWLMCRLDHEYWQSQRGGP